MSELLNRYWFEFANESTFDLPPGIGIGCGVTAYTLGDELNLIRNNVFGGNELPVISRQIANIDVDALDKEHVIPNMLDVHTRRIWFPIGYQ